VPAVLPPTPGAEARLDDWIAALAALPPLAFAAAAGGKKGKAAASGGGGGGGDGAHAAAAPLAAGCYDGVVRIWTADAGVAAEWAAHEGPVKAVACAPGARGAAGGMLLTGGDDCAARAWAWRGGAPGGAPEAVATLAGHAAAVEAAAVGPGGGLAATGGWDGQLLLWRWGEALLESAGAGAPAADGAAAAARKRRRAAAPPPEEAAAGALGGHTGCVAALCWAAPDALISGSWDASVRRWDPEVGAAADALHHDKAVHAVAAAPGGDGRLVAFGGAERALRLWDARTGGAAVGVRGLASHSAWVSALAWHPDSAHALLSASHDGSAKLWDLRAAVPLASVAAGGGEKLLAAAWASPGAAAVGGADCALRTFGVEL
jgi:ribosome biogenesis protein YTM1